VIAGARALSARTGYQVGRAGGVRVFESANQSSMHPLCAHFRWRMTQNNLASIRVSADRLQTTTLLRNCFPKGLYLKLPAHALHSDVERTTMR
jgi:hypothetical protein